jgi:paraquat-inducible protein A
LPPPGRGQIAECARCGRTLAGPTTGRISAPLALCLAALLLLVPAAIEPLMVVSTYGAQRSTVLPASAVAMWRDGFPSLGLLVGAFSMVLPAVFLTLLIWVLASLHLGKRRGVGAAFRWSRYLRPWVMFEVYLVGGFVAYSRINTMTTVAIGSGGWCLVASAFVMLVALIELDERTVWEMLERPLGPAAGGPTISCTVCNLMVPVTAGRHCPRCRARLSPRKPRSLQATTALVVASCLLYVPANVLPVLTTVRLGHEEHNTILSGVFELARNDLWPLALIVFTASIVLPLVKLVGLTWMLLSIRTRSARYLVGRTRLYRIIDTVGRWSNVDVFAVAVLVAVLQFGELTAVHAGNGLVAFAAVVILTMVATAIFDARLMWDVSRRAHD